MPDKLREKLNKVEDDLRQMRAERAEKAKAREKAKEDFANSDADPSDTNSEQFKAAREAVRAVGELDDKIADAQLAQVEILKMLGQEAPREVAKTLDGKDGAGGQGWNAAALFADSEIRQRLGQIAGTRMRFGSIQLGQVVSREMLAAEIGGTDNSRRGTFQGIRPQAYRPLRLLDLIPTGTTDGNSLPYTQEQGDFTGPAETPEGQQKPEADFDLVDADAPVRTIAAWTKVRKQALSDIAGLQTIVDTRLRYAVMRRLEAQVLAGDGTGENLEGILNTTGIGTVDAAVLTTLNKAELFLTAITNIYLADGEASASVAAPQDWQEILMLKTDGSGEYLGGGPFAATAQVLWGVPLLPSPALAAGSGVVGDFNTGVTLMIREGVNVLMSDADQDDFIRNRVTLLGETRVALPVWRPPVFQEVVGL